MVRVDDALAAAFPGAGQRTVRMIETGWDTVAVAVDGGWILRVARRDVVAARYQIEAALVPELAPTLPLAIPVPLRVGDGWILTRRIPGEPFADQPEAATFGSQLGTFMRRLHDFPVQRARELGAATDERTRDAQEFRSSVLPLLELDEQGHAAQLPEEYERQAFDPAVIHMDIGPEHVLVEDARVTGVIDWTDARIGDPAIDLAWPLHGAPPAFARAVAEAYGVGAALLRRARVYYAVGPWHEVVHGLEADPSWIERGLAGIRERLAAMT